MVSHNPERLLLEREETNDPPVKRTREESPPPITGTRVWFPPRQRSGETLPEFRVNAPHQYRPTLPQRTLFQPPVEQRRSAQIPISRVIPNNAYGNRPLVEIE